MRSLVLFLFAAAAFAQSGNSGTITGIVVDIAGDVVANAPIE